jgi:CDP-4-dehydro-6-deoxyglucose reductase, E1
MTMLNKAKSLENGGVQGADISRLRREILEKVGEYYHLAHQTGSLVPGETFVHYGGRVYDEREMQSAVDAILDFWLTDGPRAEVFSRALGDYLGLKHILTLNSGSSANLLAMTVLRSAQLDRQLRPGDEVITPATTFPTTVAPIMQNGLIPVFIDSKVGT